MGFNAGVPPPTSEGTVRRIRRGPSLGKMLYNELRANLSIFLRYAFEIYLIRLIRLYCMMIEN